MKRKIYDSMRKWEEENGRTALLIDGARRVGKSYIAQEFTKREYKRYILIDFNHAPAEITDLFVHYLNDFRVKRDILELYRADIIKHTEGYQMKVAQIFDDIPAQLQKHDTKFKFSSLKKEARFREYEDALFWLSDAMITNICYNSTAPNIGLKPNMDRMTLKCYMADTGLLISHAFDENGLVSEEIYKKLLFDKLEVNKGMIIENIVAQMLTASGHKLYFYSNPSRDDASLRMEIDFLTAKSKISNRHNISPIEVKSSKNYTLTSLRKFKGKYKDQLHIPYVLHPNDLKEEDGILFLPLYMTPLI